MIDDNINQIEYKLAKCCNPIKGDDIFGFVTISSGITIHRTDCPNARRMRENYPYRVIDARWRQTAEGAFRVTIRIVAADTTGMANHITETVIRDLKLNIRSMNLASRGGSAHGYGRRGGACHERRRHARPRHPAHQGRAEGFPDERIAGRNLSSRHERTVRLREVAPSVFEGRRPLWPARES